MNWPYTERKRKTILVIIVFILKAEISILISVNPIDTLPFITGYLMKIKTLFLFLFLTVHGQEWKWII
jgi:hypothetical protein